jgi:hypothetical protein
MTPIDPLPWQITTFLQATVILEHCVVFAATAASFFLNTSVS